MNTKKTIIGLGLVVSLVIGIILFQTSKVKRVNTVYILNPFEVCFVVDQNYVINPKDGGFEYSAGQNKGVVTLEKRSSFSKGMSESDLNGIRYSYQKLKNYRVFEYMLDESFILKDYFLYKKRAPVHLTLYRDECAKMQQMYQAKFLDLEERG